MDFDFLSPLHNEILHFANELSPQHLGSKIALHTKDEFPDLNSVKIAFLGVLENRGDANAENVVNLTKIRKELYSLFPGNWNLAIADLGDLNAGNTKEDTYFALQKVTAALLKNKIIVFVLGGSQDLTYPLYRAYDQLEQMVNLVAIDSKFDFGKESDAISTHSYLSKIIIEEPNNLFNYCNIGYQTYYNPQEEIDLLEKLFFDAYRLGDVSHNITIAEHVIRDADFVSVDLTAVKSSASGNLVNFAPNGFTGKEVCALARYAGISDKVSLFGLFNHNNSNTESVLIAQMVWYFIEGVHYRSNEYPFGNKDNYLKYIIPSEDEELVFYKSNKTDRWWIEIPYLSATNNKLKKSTLLPCSYEEYLAACNQEIPERWWKAQRKNIL